jgi:uncharacterized membrane protein YgaE (UPF0421/DUF939 family)
MVKITIVGLVVAFLIYFIMTSPDEAVHIAKGTGHLAANVAHGIANFVDKLAS